MAIIFFIYFLYLVLMALLSFMVRSQIRIYTHRGDISHLVMVIYVVYIGIVIFLTLMAIILNYAFNF